MYTPTERSIDVYRWHQFAKRYKYLILTVAIVTLPIRFISKFVKRSEMVSILIAAGIVTSITKFA